MALTLSRVAPVPPPPRPLMDAMQEQQQQQQQQPARGYQGFGSFFVETSIETLIAQPAAEYRPPPPLVDDDDLLRELAAGADGEPLPFGAAARRCFLIDFDRWTFLNHGAFGGVSRASFEATARWRRLCEAQPLVHFDRDLLPRVVQVTRDLAALVHAEPAELVVTQNATAALNAFIFCFPLQPGDAVFTLDIAYGSVKKMLAEAARNAGAEYVEAAVRFPLLQQEAASASAEGADLDEEDGGGAAADALVALVAASLPPNARLAVFDAVTSNTAVRLPLHALTRLCHARGCRVLVDGAHALGAFGIDLRALGADAFAGNCHKHFCGPRGTGFLHVASHDLRARVRPRVMSHGADDGFFSAFSWDGNRDYAPVLALGTALRWWRALGPDRAHAYMRELLAAAVDVLLARWRTNLLVPLALCSNMALVRLPAAAPPPAGATPAGPARSAQPVGDARRLRRAPAPTEAGPCTSADSKEWQEWLHAAARVEAPVKTVHGWMYVRITAHLYNALSDYETLAEAVAGALQLDATTTTP